MGIIAIIKESGCLWVCWNAHYISTVPKIRTKKQSQCFINSSFWQFYENRYALSNENNAIFPSKNFHKTWQT